MKDCVLVLSSPGSGSSCLTGCLHLCGASLGKNVAQVKDEWNQKGYFDNASLLTLNSSILRSHGVDMFGLQMTQIRAQPDLDCLVEVLSEKCARDSFFAIKDPRILFMRELYTEALAAIGFLRKVVRLERNKEDVIASIRSFPIAIHPNLTDVVEKPAILLQEWRDYEVCDVRFEDVIRFPRKTVSDLCRVLSLKYNPEVESFVDRTLHHEALLEI